MLTIPRSLWLRILTSAAAHEHRVLAHQPRHSVERLATVEFLNQLTTLRIAKQVEVKED